MFFIFNVLVFFGGKSPEREISIITGLLTLNSIDKSLYNPIPIYADGEGKFWSGTELSDIRFYKNFQTAHLSRAVFSPGDSCLIFKKKNKLEQIDIYCAVNCMHGRFGEDGTLVGLLRLCNIPFVSPDLFASALAIDKDFTKIILSGLDIPTVNYTRVKRKDFFSKQDKYIEYVGKKIGYPLIIKPARLGSSIGIKKVDDENMLFQMLCECFNYDDKVICEKYLSNARDLNCAVYQVKGEFFISDIEEAFHSCDILSFADKYGGGNKGVGNVRKKANDLSEAQKEKIKEYSKKVYRKLDFTSIVRIDFLLDNDNIYLNEINAVPGSMAYYLFCDKISEFTQLLNELIADAIDRKRKEDNYLTFYNSEVLYGDYSGIKK